MNSIIRNAVTPPKPEVAPLVLRYTEATSHPLTVALEEAEISDKGLWVLMRSDAIDLLMISETDGLGEALVSMAAESGLDEGAQVQVQWKGEDGARVDFPAGTLSEVAEHLDAYIPENLTQGLEHVESVRDEILIAADTLAMSSRPTL